MKPLELACVAGVWRSALTITSQVSSLIGEDLQIWFPWGKTWRGQDLKGGLPPTALPEELLKEGVSRFGGRFWKRISVDGTTWLVSLSAPRKAISAVESWQIPTEAIESLKMLGNFLRLESLLGLSMKVLENQAKENTGHWDRVRNFSAAIGRDLGLSARELAELEIAAMLHDIGKIGLPSEILESADNLNPTNRKKMQEHSIIGASMLREVPGMERISEYILYHHEAPDGSGYPCGLKYDDIPYSALIIAVADSFDAMTHYRPYATERTYRESFDEMSSEKGKFAPEILDALERVLKTLGILDFKPLVK